MSTPEELALATRVLAEHDLIGMYGHVSVLPDPGAQEYLLSPGAGFRKQDCGPRDVVSLRFDDEFRPGLPLELYMHSETHRRHPEVRALVHTHAPALTELSLYADVPGDAMLLHAAFWPEEVPVYELPRLVVRRDQAQGLVDVVGTSSVTLLRWHGAVVTGRSLSEAVFRTIYAEKNARLLLDGLRGTGKRVALPSGAEREDIAEQIITDRMLGLHWGYEAAADAARDRGEDR
ncbi:class II aldolase/adducin family protein [Rugosimonospora acidiphila]|uniref:Class II aldolase/adducin family protein n=1 Tax=Rugosimonospora acidiphila TaxID=556531 RepID=A0ABP9S3J9_9ACTN